MNAEIFHNMTFEDYARIPALNASLAKMALQSPTKAAYYLTAEKPRTEALLFGTYWHAAMLEPHTLPQVAVAAGGVRTKSFSTRSTGQEAKDWLRENPGKVAVDEQDFQTCMGMVDRLRGDGYSLGSGWKTEAVIVWTGEDGIRRKARYDGLNLDALSILEAKTAESVKFEDFQKAICNYSYDVAAFHYCQGVQALTGKLPTFHFLAQEKDAPHDWLFVEADRDMLECGGDAMRLVTKMYLKTEGFTKPERVQLVVPATIGMPKWFARNLAMYEGE